MGTATFLTDGNGLPYEFFLNLPFGETMAEQHSQTADYENRWKFTGHELDKETGLYYAGARYYDPKISIWLSVDPLAEKFPSWNPYNYVMQNPINLTDPTGMSPESEDDPIYGKTFWGKVKQIGDDGQNNNVSYLVKGSVKKDVKEATEQGLNYTGSLQEGDKVIIIPNGNKLADVDVSVQATLNSGSTPETQLEQGAHTLIGDTNARHWDPGTPPVTSTRTNSDGSTDTIQTWSVTPFRINGRSQVGGNANQFEFIWHTHPNGSNPSPNDISTFRGWRQHGFGGNSFLIDVKNGKVTFFNERGTITKISYSDFQRMGNRQNIR